MDHRHAHAPASGAHRLLSQLPVHIAGAALLVLLAALSPSPWWAAAAAFLGLAFTATLARAVPAALILLGPVIVLRLTELLSGVAIEGGATMVETGVRGAATGAFTRLWLIDLLAFASAALLIEWGWRPLQQRFASAGRAWRRQAGLIAVTLTLVLAGMSLILAFFAITHGVPGGGRIDRFTYLNQLEGTPYRTIIMNRVLLAPLIGVVIAVPRTRWIGCALLAWLIALSLLFAEKFTSLLFIGAAAIQPLALVTLARTGALPMRTLATALLVLAAISLPAILVTYGAADSPRRAWDRFEQRAVLQGQLWFLADRRGAPRHIDAAALSADLGSWVDPRAQRPERAGTRFGLYYVMAKFTPSHRLEGAIQSETGFVFAFYPYLLLAGGWTLLMLGALVVALFQATILLLVAQALYRCRWLAILAFGRVANSINATLVTGYAWNIFGPKTLVAAVLGIILLRIRPPFSSGIGSFRIESFILNKKITTR